MTALKSVIEKLPNGVKICLEHMNSLNISLEEYCLLSSIQQRQEATGDYSDFNFDELMLLVDKGSFDTIEMIQEMKDCGLLEQGPLELQFKTTSLFNDTCTCQE